MKKWNAAELVELNIEETAHDWFGNSRDGGRVGDGIISGHLEWKDNNGNGDNEESGDKIS